jgi:hypothetical protein
VPHTQKKVLLLLVVVYCSSVFGQMHIAVLLLLRAILFHVNATATATAKGNRCFVLQGNKTDSADHGSM